MRRITLLLVMSLGWVVATVGVAQASCLAPPPLEQGIADAQVVFVGTVVDYGGDQRQAIVEVDSVWKGEGVATLVGVDGGFAPNAATSVDRFYQAGERYIFFPTTEEFPFLDNSCTLTQQMTDEIEALTPATAKGPVDGETIAFPPPPVAPFPGGPVGESGFDVAEPAPGGVVLEPVDVSVDEPVREPTPTVEATGEVDPVSDSYLLPLLIVGLVAAAGIGGAVAVGRMRSRPID
jgi:hypothetical protein